LKLIRLIRVGVLLILVFSASLLLGEEVSPEAWAHYIASELYRWYGKREASLKELWEAFRLDPSSIFLKKELARAYLSKGEEEEARKLLKKIYKQDKESGIILSAIYLKEGKNSKAYYLLNYLHKKFPKDKDILLLLVEASLKEGKIWKAKKWGEEFLKLKLTPEELLQLGNLYVGFGVEEGREVLEKVLEKDPKNLRALLLLGSYFEDKRDLTKAETYYEKALKVAPFYPYIYQKLAQIKFERRKWDEAISIYNTLLLFQPGNQQILSRLAYTYFRKGDKEKSLETLEKIKVHSPFTLYLLASLLLDKGEIKEAEERCKDIMKLTENFAPAYTLLSVIYKQKGDEKRAEEILKEGLKKVTRDDDKAQIYLSLGLFYVQKDKEKAATYFYKASHLAPDWDQPYFHLGALFEQRKEWDKAVYYLKRAISLNPENAEALNYLGYMYAEKGIKLKEALKLIKRALEIEPENGYFVDSLGWIYYQQGRFNKALKEIKRAIDLLKKEGEDDAVIREHLGDVYWRLGEKEKALQQWEKALKLDPGNKKVERKIRNAKRALKRK